MQKVSLEERTAAMEYSNLIGEVFGSERRAGVRARLWERRNFNKDFYTMSTRELKKGTILLLDVRKRQIIEEVRKMGEKYTQEELDSMSDAEICEVVIDLNIINRDDLIADILTLSA